MVSSVTSSLIDVASLHEPFGEPAHQFCREFKALLRPYGRFHIVCFGAAALQLLAILFFSSSSFLLAIALATLCLTAFSYLLLLFYFQAKKPEQLLLLKEHLMRRCRTIQSLEQMPTDFAPLLYQLIAALDKQEYTYYPLPPSFAQLTPLSERMSGQIHWRDFLQMKEILLREIIDISLQKVKAQPTAISAHAALAQAYTALSKLYLDPRKSGTLADETWVSSAYRKEELLHKFHVAALRALEELQIIFDLAPQETWIHASRAAIYRDLSEVEQEIASYEAYLAHHPEDRKALFRLGRLFFEEGHMAKGLRIYAQLKEAQDPRAEELLSLYSS